MAIQDKTLEYSLNPSHLHRNEGNQIPHAANGAQERKVGSRIAPQDPTTQYDRASASRTFKFWLWACRTRSNRSAVPCAPGPADASFSLPRTALTSLSYMSAAGPPLPLETPAPTAADDLPGPEVIGGAPFSSSTRTASSSSRLVARWSRRAQKEGLEGGSDERFAVIGTGLSSFRTSTRRWGLLGQHLHDGGEGRGGKEEGGFFSVTYPAAVSSVHTDARQLHLSSLSGTGLSQLASSSRIDLTRRPAYFARVSVPEPCFAADSHRRSHSPLGNGSSDGGVWE